MPLLLLHAQTRFCVYEIWVFSIMAADSSSSSSSSSSDDSESEEKDLQLHAIRDQDLFNTALSSSVGGQNVGIQSTYGQFRAQFKQQSLDPAMLPSPERTPNYSSSSDDSSDSDTSSPSPNKGDQKSTQSTVQDIISYQPAKRKAAAVAENKLKRSLSYDSSSADDTDNDSTYQLQLGEQQEASDDDDIDCKRVATKRRTKKTLLTKETIIANQPKVVVTCIIKRLRQLTNRTAARKQTKTAIPSVTKPTTPSIPSAIPVHTVTPLKTVPSLFECADCDAKMNQEPDFNRHRELHKAKAIFQCIKCTFSTPHRWQIASHMKFDHVKATISTVIDALANKDGMYTCSLCEYSVNTNDKLKRHMFHHTDKKTIKCLHCSYSACTNWLISEHIKTGHMSLSEEHKKVLTPSASAFLASKASGEKTSVNTSSRISSANQKPPEPSLSTSPSLLDKQLRQQQTEIDLMKRQLREQAQEIEKQKENRETVNESKA